MKTRKLAAFWMTAALAALPVMATDNAAPAPYMGQEPPGLTPKFFAPGVINPQHDLCLSKDGRECFFTVFIKGVPGPRIMFTRFENGQWTAPVQAPFTDGFAINPSFMDGDQTLCFAVMENGDANVWKTRRAGQGWSKPEIVSTPLNSPRSEWSCVVSSLGNAWICSHRPGTGGCDLWRIRSADGQFVEATELRGLNTTAHDCHPAIGPDEGYVIWSSSAPGGFGGADLYISFADGQGGWTAPKNLGPTINTAENEGVPCLSPDDRYLFFKRNDNRGTASLCWVSARAFLPDSSGSDPRPAGGLTKPGKKDENSGRLGNIHPPSKPYASTN